MHHHLIALDECLQVALLQARVTREYDLLRCEWSMTGILDQVLWPVPGEHPQRIVGLWEHTCFEVFIGPVDESEYTEINLSPAGDWNAFAFDDVRMGMKETDRVSLADCNSERTPTTLTLAATFRFEPFPVTPLRVGISAVIEVKGNALHYFALAHTGATPDFHRREHHLLMIDG